MDIRYDKLSQKLTNNCRIIRVRGKVSSATTKIIASCDTCNQVAADAGSVSAKTDAIHHRTRYFVSTSYQNPAGKVGDRMPSDLCVCFLYYQCVITCALQSRR